MRIFILLFFGFIQYLDVSGQNSISFKPSSKEVRGYLDEVWRKEEIYKPAIIIDADDAYSNIKISISENNKVMILHFVNTKKGIKWTTDEGYEFNVAFLRGKDVLDKIWEADLYIPMKNYYKPLLVLKDEKLVIRYK